MSHTVSRGKRRPPPGGGGKRRGGFDRSVCTEGVYANSRMVHTATSLVGLKVNVHVKNGSVYDGIFKTFSSKLDICLEQAHRLDSGHQQSHHSNSTTIPARDCLHDKVMFNLKDVVMIESPGVDMEVVQKDGFVDAAITSNKPNGNAASQEKELTPWESGPGPGDELESLEESSTQSNGWDVHKMFDINKKKFNIKSTYDPNLSQYTVPLVPENTAEWRKREETAHRIAREIETSDGYQKGLALENGADDADEEMAFSAVHRNEGGDTSGPAGKYVPPHLRRNAQQGRPARAANQNTPDTQGPPSQSAPPGQATPTGQAMPTSTAEAVNQNVATPSTEQPPESKSQEPPTEESSAEVSRPSESSSQSPQTRPTRPPHSSATVSIIDAPVVMDTKVQQDAATAANKSEPLRKMSGGKTKDRDATLSDLKDFGRKFKLNKENEGRKEGQSPTSPNNPHTSPQVQQSDKQGVASTGVSGQNSTFNHPPLPAGPQQNTPPQGLPTQHQPHRVTTSNQPHHITANTQPHQNTQSHHINTNPQLHQNPQPHHITTNPQPHQNPQPHHMATNPQPHHITTNTQPHHITTSGQPHHHVSSSSQPATMHHINPTSQPPHQHHMSASNQPPHHVTASSHHPQQAAASSNPSPHPQPSSNPHHQMTGPRPTAQQASHPAQSVGGASLQHPSLGGQQTVVSYPPPSVQTTQSGQPHPAVSSQPPHYQTANPSQQAAGLPHHLPPHQIGGTGPPHHPHHPLHHPPNHTASPQHPPGQGQVITQASSPHHHQGTPPLHQQPPPPLHQGVGQAPPSHATPPHQLQPALIQQQAAPRQPSPPGPPQPRQHMVPPHQQQQQIAVHQQIPPQQATPTLPEQQLQQSGDKKEDEDSLAKKSMLNPNAKEFVLNPMAKEFVPSRPAVSAPSQGATPPRPATQSPVMTAGQQPVQVGQFYPQPVYIQQLPTQPPRMNTKQRVMPNMVAMPSRPDLQAAMTGQPLVANQPAMAQQQFVQYIQTNPTYTQMVGIQRVMTPVSQAQQQQQQQQLSHQQSQSAIQAGSQPVGPPAPDSGGYVAGHGHGQPQQQQPQPGHATVYVSSQTGLMNHPTHAAPHHQATPPHNQAHPANHPSPSPIHHHQQQQQPPQPPPPSHPGSSASGTPQPYVYPSMGGNGGNSQPPLQPSPHTTPTSPQYSASYSAYMGHGGGAGVPNQGGPGGPQGGGAAQQIQQYPHAQHSTQVTHAHHQQHTHMPQAPHAPIMMVQGQPTQLPPSQYPAVPHPQIQGSMAAAGQQQVQQTQQQQQVAINHQTASGGVHPQYLQMSSQMGYPQPQ